MPRITINFSDGHYSWRMARPKDEFATMDIPAGRLFWLKLLTAAAGVMQKYLCHLDNQWHWQQERKRRCGHALCRGRVKCVCSGAPADMPGQGAEVR